ncbi:hypothetical protein [Mycolicibacterium aubagnense]|uniref:Uncharacterized protein n=1 Tax=Mycolicibacterium aubagnense TaxID=319707 RepID=A0ABN5Z4N3_9MYCO|nr:hypothetical protein [Mycolicibacterium aubagnense]TLH48568.1 hypothetical protein C1S80_29760 [Mycolicibacterium aubagnense]BBX87971.1 hypothetical protein MAUB_58440 [Mycolicibacterium aubagnense]
MYGDLSEFEARFSQGYTPEDINRVLGRIQLLTVTRIICVWEYFDDDGYGGNSELFFIDRHTAHELAGQLWPWLLDGRSEAPHGPGDAASWKGRRADFDYTSLSGDGLHNCARAVRD